MVLSTSWAAATHDVVSPANDSPNTATTSAFIFARGADTGGGGGGGGVDSGVAVAPVPFRTAFVDGCSALVGVEVRSSVAVAAGVVVVRTSAGA